jgi:amino acid permease
VVVAFRKIILKSVKNALLIGLLPLIGAVFMFWILGESIPSDGGVVVWVGLGGLAIGLIPLVAYWVLGSPYYKQKPTLGRTVPDEDTSG